MVAAMTRLLALSASLLTLALTGCGEDSSEIPVDGRDFDGVGFSETQRYSGKVIDGYLRNARVWLDLDGDSQYTPGPLVLELESGTQVTLENGEPTVMTGAGGQFVLDISELVRDPVEAPNLDPRDYPLVALVLPGQTIDETREGGVVLEEAYMLSASPGIRNVTPLTTLTRQRQLIGVPQLVTGSNELADALGNVNLVGDYVQSADHRAHAYAQALARFLASQFPGFYGDILRNGDGTEAVLSQEAVFLLGVSFAQNALAVVQAVDGAAPSGRYENINIAELELPEVPLDLDDPVLLRTQKISAKSVGNNLPTSNSNLTISAELSFDYLSDGRLASVTAEGCMAPSLRQIARLANAGGRIADTDIQWLPTVSLAQESRTFYEAEGADERLVFDWSNRTASFETTTTCHPGLAASSELGGTPAVTYQWTLGQDGRVTSITDGERTLEPAYEFANSAFFGYHLTAGETTLADVALDGQITSCNGSIAEEDQGASHVVSAQQPYTFTDIEAAPEGFADLVLEFDLRGSFDRLLRFSFLGPGLAAAEHVSNEEGFQWLLYYPTTSQEDYVADQPNLISDALLTRFSASSECGRDVSTRPTSGLYARVLYEYQKLSEYLTERVE